MSLESLWAITFRIKSTAGFSLPLVFFFSCRLYYHGTQLLNHRGQRDIDVVSTFADVNHLGAVSEIGEYQKSVVDGRVCLQNVVTLQVGFGTVWGIAVGDRGIGQSFAAD